jgi:alpha/beta superfamily hydrolase
MPLLCSAETPPVLENVVFPAGPHKLHGELAYPETGSVRAAAVLAGPHPLLGGNMHNNVVRALGDGLAHKGMLTLRFDYRGVGRSQGPPVDVARNLAAFWQTSHVPGEMDFWTDLQAAIALVRQTATGLPLALVGYSFGCALLPLLPPADDLVALVLVAPTVARHDYDAYRAVRSPLLVVASEDDFATDADHLEEWFGKLSMPRQLVRRRCDNHFFRGHEPWLLDTVGPFLDRHVR